MAEIAGRPILWYLYRQLSFCTRVANAILATTDNPRDDVLAAYAESEGWPVFRGDESDVLKRYVDAAEKFGAQADTAIVRLTGDDIHPDPRLVDGLVAIYESMKGTCDVVTLDRSGRIPYGAGIELARFGALRQAHNDAIESADREHVTRHLHRNPNQYSRFEVVPSEDIPCVSLSIDTEADLERNRDLLDALERIAAPPYALADLVSASALIQTPGQS